MKKHYSTTVDGQTHSRTSSHEYRFVILVTNAPGSYGAGITWAAWSARLANAEKTAAKYRRVSAFTNVRIIDVAGAVAS